MIQVYPINKKKSFSTNDKKRTLSQKKNYHSGKKKQFAGKLFSKVVKIKAISAHGNQKMKYQILSIVGDQSGNCGFAINKSVVCINAIRSSFASASKRMKNYSAILNRNRISRDSNDQSSVRFSNFKRNFNGKIKNFKILIQTTKTGGLKGCLVFRTICTAIGIENASSKLLVNGGNIFTQVNCYFDALDKMLLIDSRCKRNFNK